MKKLLVVLCFGMFIILSAQAYAHEGRLAGDGCHNDTINGGRHCHDSEGNIISENNTQIKAQKVNAQKVEIYDMRTTKAQGMSQLKERKSEMREEIDENRMQAKENRKTFKEENKAEIQEIRESLTDEEQSELENVRESFKSEFEALREDMKQAQSEEEKEMIRDEMNQLKEAQYIKIGEIIGESAFTLIEERKSVSEENEALREESREIRGEYKAERKQYIDIYKGAFIKRIGNRLDKIPTANLEKAAEKIDVMLEKIENDQSMSEDRKQARLDAVLALKEIIEDRLENDESEEDILDIFSDILEDE